MRINQKYPYKFTGHYTYMKHNGILKEINSELNGITKQCYMCTNLVPLCFSQKLEQIAGFHQFKNDEVWIVVDAYSNDLEHILMVKVAKEA